MKHIVTIPHGRPGDGAELRVALLLMVKESQAVAFITPVNTVDGVPHEGFPIILAENYLLTQKRLG